MHKFRSTWLALMGGAILVTLSISAAFGADPVDETDTNRGQTVAGFVHSLIFTQDEPADDDVVDEEEDADETDEDADETDEEADEADETDEDADEADEELVETDVTGAEHGACVSEAANKEASGDEEAEENLSNHGEWVSLHAQFICWGLTPPDEEAAEDDTALEDDADTEEAAAKAARTADKLAARADKVAARAEQAEARDAARAERADARAAAKAERASLRLAAQAERGHGGGKP